MGRGSLPSLDGSTPSCETSPEEVPGHLGLGGCRLQGPGRPGPTVWHGDSGPAGTPTEAHRFLVLSVLPPTSAPCHLLLVRFWGQVPGGLVFSGLPPSSPTRPREGAHAPGQPCRCRGRSSSRGLSRPGGGLPAGSPVSVGTSHWQDPCPGKQRPATPTRTTC